MRHNLLSNAVSCCFRCRLCCWKGPQFQTREHNLISSKETAFSLSKFTTGAGLGAFVLMCWLVIQTESPLSGLKPHLSSSLSMQIAGESGSDRYHQEPVIISKSHRGGPSSCLCLFLLNMKNKTAAVKS